MCTSTSVQEQEEGECENFGTYVYSTLLHTCILYIYILMGYLILSFSATATNQQSKLPKHCTHHTTFIPMILVYLSSSTCIYILQGCFCCLCIFWYVLFHLCWYCFCGGGCFPHCSAFSSMTSFLPMVHLALTAAILHRAT